MDARADDRVFLTGILVGTACGLLLGSVLGLQLGPERRRAVRYRLRHLLRRDEDGVRFDLLV